MQALAAEAVNLLCMYYVYIIQSQKDSSYYVGVTEDLERRVSEHNRDGMKFTSSRRPYALAWYCAFKEKKQAIEFEKYLKHGSGFAFARKRLL